MQFCSIYFNNMDMILNIQNVSMLASYSPYKIYFVHLSLNKMDLVFRMRSLKAFSWLQIFVSKWNLIDFGPDSNKLTFYVMT